MRGITHSCFGVGPNSVCLHFRMTPRKNMQYTSECLSAALVSIRKGSRIRQVSRSSGIPESTLRDKLKGLHQQSKPGAPTVLTGDEENRIVEWVLDMAKMGFPVNTQKLTTCVAHFVKGRKTKFKDGIPGEKWIESFLKRHPNVARRVPSVLPKYRAEVSEASLRQWFTEIQAHVNAEGNGCVLKDPSRIFNMDETAVRTIPTKEVVLAETGTHHLYARVGNSDKESYTALFAANALGTLAPSLMLFPYKQRIPGEIIKNLPPNWAAGRTESGWMNRDTFYLYLRDIFHPWLLKEKVALPIIVFVDGHKSHVSPLTTELCQKTGIVLICLPPNSTQTTQPLDVSFFRPVKCFWNQLLIEWRIDNRGEMLTRSEIAPLLQKAVDKMPNLTSTLVNGFRRSGLYPFDMDAIDYGSLVTNSQKQSAVQTPDPFPGTAGSSSSYTRPNDFVRQLESYLTKEQMQCFEENANAEAWPGSIKDTNLFVVWKKAKFGLGTSNTASSMSRFAKELEDEPPFEGFEVDDQKLKGISFYSSHKSSNTKITNIFQSVAENVSDAPGPSTAKPPRMANDPFSDSFRTPALRVPVRKIKKDHPPAVVTSKAYKEYENRINEQKQREENERQKKKEQKLLKKKQKEIGILQRKFDRFLKQKK